MLEKLKRYRNVNHISSTLTRKYFSKNVLKYISSGTILRVTSLDQKMDRPLGVTVIAILIVIGGIMSLFGGITLIIVWAILSTSFIFQLALRF